MTEPRRRYTKAQRAAAVGLAVAEGQTAAAAKSGIPKSTIQSWLDRPEFVELRTKTREAVAERFWAAVQVGLDEVASGLRGDAPLRDKAIALGVLYDKFALLSGQPTARTESRDIPTFDDHEIAALRDAIDSLTREAEGVTEAPGS